jgi:AbrB family looped-hinge helix DNA binding protein
VAAHRANPSLWQRLAVLPVFVTVGKFREVTFMEDVSVRVDKLGRILLPAGVRRAAGFEPNARLMVRVHEGHVELMTLAAALRTAQAIVRARVPAGRSLAADLIRERRSEVRRERRGRR